VQVVEHLRGVMLLQMTGDKSLLTDQPLDAVAEMAEQTQKLDRAQTLYAIKRFSEAIAELKGGIQPQLPLELALIEAAQGAALPTPVQTVAKPVVQTATSVAPQSITASVQPPQTASEAPTSKGEPKMDKAESKTLADDTAQPPPLDEASIRRLRARWNDFLSIVKTKCGFKQEAALRAVRDIAVGEQSVAFAFGNNKFAREMLAAPETLNQVAEILSQILGRTVSLTCQTGETAVLSASAGRIIREQSDANGPDPLVEYAVKELGARVLDE
jgi:DNA polymerase III gamma/tau subunit